MSAVYFTDRDLGNLVPRILREAGLTVERHADHFRHDTPDKEWLETAGRNEWYVLTHNERIRYTPNQVRATMTHGVGLFILIGAAPHPQLAENFVRTSGRAESFIGRTARPFIAKVLRPSSTELKHNREAPGRVELWLSRDEWRRGS